MSQEDTTDQETATPRQRSWEVITDEGGTIATKLVRRVRELEAAGWRIDPRPDEPDPFESGIELHYSRPGKRS